MSSATSIEWATARWNPVRGCRRVSPGCEHCYAELIAARFSKPGQAYYGIARRRSNGEPQWTGETAFMEHMLYEPIRWKGPERIFVNSMSDLFYEGFDVEQIANVFAVMALARRHTFQVLTKRPARMLELLTSPEFREAVATYTSIIAMELVDPNNRRRDDLRATAPDVTEDDEWPLKNVWLGVSTENQERADERIPILLRTPAAIRFISAEPLLGPLRIDPYLEEHVYLDGEFFRGLDWVIPGGESGPHARPCHLVWIEDLIAACEFAGVACFVKQFGAKPVSITDQISYRGNTDNLPDGLYRHLNSAKGGDMAEWPERFRVRQFPLEVTHGR